ncbi:hypothetical protein MKW92_049503 [Papaver armeniacum]|nr:hypothetical protein MKW92_049503 [Papaver armeniacum]
MLTDSIEWYGYLISYCFLNRTIHPPILSCVGHYDSKFYRVFGVVNCCGRRFAVDGVNKNGVMDLYLI